MFDPSGQFELQVAPNGRAAADEYLHQGNMWIEGREGSKYVLRFINRSPQRVCVVFSVDGLDTIKGQPAGPNSEGYIVDADSTLEVPGWKLDSDTAAEFYFNKIGKSYAAQSGASTSNVGVIGAMVFREMPYHVPSLFTYTTAGSIGMGLSNPSLSINLSAPIGASGALGPQGPHGALGAVCSDFVPTSASLSGSAGMIRSAGVNAVASSAMPVEQSVGTGFGDATQFATTQTTFVRANSTVPDAMLVMYYNSGKNLQKMGIQLRTKGTRYDNTTAKAFPAYNNGCTPPPGWKP
jgi:hypothetical protein